MKADDVEVIIKSLRPVMRRGLPAPDDFIDIRLTDLRGVIARSVHPEDRVSRVDAFNTLMPRIIENLGSDFDRTAARILFGIEEGTRGSTLTVRRQRAAGDYDPDHFRKRIEPRILHDIALDLHRDSLRYKSFTRRAPRSLEPTGDTPRLDTDDLTAQEELISRIWSEVYSIRAELIAAARKQPDESYALQVEEHRQLAAAHGRSLEVLIASYIDTYGERLVKHGENEFDVEGLKRLADWRLE